MEPMKWYEIIGSKLGIYKWCPACYKMRWFHNINHAAKIEQIDVKWEENDD